MTIEFHCPYCQKLLKTGDDRAGVRANCPGCGQSVTVPELAQETASVDPSFLHARPMSAAGDTPEARTDEPAQAAGAGVSTPTKICPMCGETILQAATRCRYCGETLADRQPQGVPAPIDAGDVLGRSWRKFQEHLGILIGSTVVLVAVTIAVVMALYAILAVVAIATFGLGGGPPPKLNPGAIVALVAAYAVFIVGILAVNAFLQGGYHVLLLKVARGERAEITDLFSGGRFFWRLFWGNVLFSLLQLGGMILLVVPYFFVLLIFWPFSFVIVDQDVGVIESFRRSREVTSGNLLAIFVLGLAGFGIYLLGSMACGIGVIFSLPLIVLSFTIAYCVMSGRTLASPPHA